MSAREADSIQCMQFATSFRPAGFAADSPRQIRKDDEGARKIFGISNHFAVARANSEWEFNRKNSLRLQMTPPEAENFELFQSILSWECSVAIANRI